MINKNYRSYHNKSVAFWIEELRKNNPRKRYCILLDKPRPDAIEVDLETGKISAMEFENYHTTIRKEKFYQKTLSDFDEVYIKCRRSEIRFLLKP